MSHLRVLRDLGRWLTNRPARPVVPQPVIGVALGGGFARGLAHIGVLKVLEENRIPIHLLSGTSVGSIVAGAYASGTSVLEMTEIAGKIHFHDFARWTLSRMGLASNARMEQFLRRCFKKKTFEELRIPLAVTATDITNGDEVVFRSGELVDPVRASCAYPALFLPVKIGGRTLIDGAFASPVPVGPLAQMGATHIIAVHLICNPFPSTLPTNLFQMVGHCFSILQTRIGPKWRETAHCIIEPVATGHAWDSFEHVDQLIAAGEQATRAALPKLQSWIEPRLTPVLAYSR